MWIIFLIVCFQSVTEGYNGTVFAYGQTGCGKSFTMQGVCHPASQKGIIPRAFEHIFEAISTTENTKYLVHASYLEIYNEEIRDLLGKETKKKLELKEHPDKGVYVSGKTWFVIFYFFFLSFWDFCYNLFYSIGGKQNNSVERNFVL